MLNVNSNPIEAKITVSNQPFAKASVRYAYIIGIVLFFLAIIGFYYVQNQANRMGGAISLAKAFWLGLAVFYWYFLPLILIVDNRSQSPQFYTGLKLFYLSMLLRAVLELYLMYAHQAWHYSYGIAHNLLSLAILSTLALISKKTLEKPLKITLYLLIAMFIAEIYFASYMLIAVQNGYQQTIWFIDGSQKHRYNNAVTTAIVIFISLWQIIFYYQWFHKANKKM